VIDISTLHRSRGRTPFGRRGTFAVAIVAAAMLALPLAASAQTVDPTSQQYNSTLQTLSTGSSGNTPGGSPSSTNNAGSPTPPAAGAPSATSTGGSLPFTGLDVGLLAVVAGGLVLAGFMLRRQAREGADRA
jgi:hypothetical protein